MRPTLGNPLDAFVSTFYKVTDPVILARRQFVEQEVRLLTDQVLLYLEDFGHPSYYLCEQHHNTDNTGDADDEPPSEWNVEEMHPYEAADWLANRGLSVPAWVSEHVRQRAAMPGQQGTSLYAWNRRDESSDYQLNQPLTPEEYMDAMERLRTNSVRFGH
jgi:hypothetical protein